MIRAVIADDEVLARQKLRQLLSSDKDLEILGECASAREVLQLVSSTKPDLLFLDIRMPDMDGFDVLEALLVTSAHVPQIIFTTAYDQYAVRAFECHAADYLLKPFTERRLRAAVARVRGRLRQDKTPDEQLHEHGRATYTSRFVFRSRGRILFLPIEEIRCIQAEQNYVRISAGSETHLLRETMGRLEERLDPDIFLRVHRSSIVNLRYVKEVMTETDGEAMVVLMNGEKVAMSRGYRSRIHRLLQR